MIERPTDAQRHAWMAQWHAAAIALEEIRQDEFRDADLGQVAASLNDACIESVRAHGLSPTSGLIAQQRIFHRAAGV